MIGRKLAKKIAGKHEKWLDKKFCKAARFHHNGMWRAIFGDGGYFSPTTTTIVEDALFSQITSRLAFCNSALLQKGGPEGKRMGDDSKR